MAKDWTVSRYILQRLKQAGVDHLFGVPGDYVLDFLDEVLASPVRWVGTCNELNAGYAADGYARLKGLGGAAVTYGGGGLSILNAVAGAFAEQVPVIVVSGAPPARRREAGARVHHLVDTYQLQLDLFRKITAAAVQLTDPETAPAELDRVLAASLARKLPGYIELPADMAGKPCRAPDPDWRPVAPVSDPAQLAAAVAATAARFDRAVHPLALVGMELAR